MTYKNVDNFKCICTKYFLNYIMPGLMKLLDEHFKFLRLLIFEVQQNNMLYFQKYLIFYYLCFSLKSTGNFDPILNINQIQFATI